MKSVLTVLWSVLCLTAQAQTMRQLWISMPDSIAPYLTESNRTELADYVAMNMESAIQNQLKDTTRIRLLEADYIDVSLSESSRLQMKLLPWSRGQHASEAEPERLLCVVRTYAGPAAESDIAFYDSHWHPVSADQLLPSAYMTAMKGHPEELCQSFLLHPDSVSNEEYQELVALLSPYHLAMQLSPTTNTLSLSLSLPPLSREELSRVERFLVQRKLNWEGGRFK